MFSSNIFSKKFPQPLQHQLYALILCTILTIISFHFIDQAIVFGADAHHSRNYFILDWLTHLSDPLGVFIFLAYPILIIRFYYQKNTYHDRVLLALANSVVIAGFIKESLKSIFGRYWPATWTNNNLSLLRDNVYGFNWFHKGSAYESFPSGHTAVIAAAMAVLWIAYPRLRWFAVLIVALMMFSQVGLYYHFLSDTIAGAFLGYLVAYNVCTLSKIKYNYSPHSSSD